MKIWVPMACLDLAACGGSGDSAANRAAATSTDAVTAEAVRDTEAAEVDAMKAADAELDNLNGTIEQPAKGGDGKRAGDRAKGDEAISKSTKVVVY